MSTRITELRTRHPAWGARKLQAVLLEQGLTGVPSVSTVHAVLERAGLIDEAQSHKHQAFIRFEHERAHDLWQMDFKGHVMLSGGARLHPLTILDDHSRYALRVAACGDERWRTVQEQLISTFERHGMPLRMNMDNGSPWGDAQGAFTRLMLWLLRLGVRVSYSAPYHPQTNGKDERFHRTLKAELLARQVFDDLKASQLALDAWVQVYNELRPHQALGLKPPACRYAPSPRAYTGQLAPLLYPIDDAVRKVCAQGYVFFKGGEYRLGRAFAGEAVALRPCTARDGLYDVFYASFRVGQINLHDRSIESHRKMLLPSS